MKSWEKTYIERLVRHSTLLEEMPKGYTVYVKYFWGHKGNDKNDAE